MSSGADPHWVVELLAPHHDRTRFSCGKQPLDSYLQRQARQDARRHVAAPFVAVTEPGDSTILGYYTLSAFGLEPSELPEAVARKLPRYPLLPATLLGRLAVDRRQGSKGLGRYLLTDALTRAAGHSQQIAAIAVVVDALDEEACRFYRHFGFLPFPDRVDRLFLPMRDIVDMVIAP